MKILGYILAVLGLVGVAAYSIPEFYTYTNNFLKGSFGDAFVMSYNVLLVVSIVLVLLGVFFIFKSGGRRRSSGNVEVPIYHGSRVVGYRRG